MQFRLFNRVFTFLAKKSGKDFKFSIRITKLEKCVLGINSNIDELDVYDDGKHILLIDYDDKLTLEELIIECKRLQEKFKNILGDAYIFESSPKKYHVHFYQPMNYWVALKIIHFSNCDEQFKKWRMCRDRMTLRMTPKEDGYVPKFVMCVPSRYPKNEVIFLKKQIANILFFEQRRLMQNAKR